MNVDKFVDPEVYFEGMKNIIENDGPPFETSIKRKDGITYPVEIHGNIATLEGKAILLGYIRDMSLLKEAQEELQRVQEKLNREIPA